MEKLLIGKLLLISTTFIGLALINSKQQTTLANPANAANGKSSTSSIQYRCEERNGNYSTIANTERGAIELIVWQNDFFASSGYTPQRRCQEVTSRFQQHYQAQNLRYISTGKINNYNVICISEKSGECKPDGLLITLEPRDEPEQVLQDLFNLTARRSGGGITRTGGRSGSLKQIIDLDKFLAESSVIDDSNTIEPQNRDRTSANQSTNDNSTNSDRTIIENPFDDL